MPNGTAIMTTTLPTIVGMGVVAETTRVMFDRRRRQAGAKAKATPKSKPTRSTKKDRSDAAKKAWRTRRKKYGKDGRRG